MRYNCISICYKVYVHTAYNSFSVPPICARDTPNFATSTAKLVCRASRKGRSVWLGLEPQPTLNSELDFKAILNFSPLLKFVISVPDHGVTRLLYFINMSSKRPTPTSAGSTSYKKDFNKGVLPATYIWSYIKKGNVTVLQ